MYLFGDTETTGFPKNGERVQDDQARVCQLALLLTDDKGQSMADFSCLIKPDGWVISEGAQAVHGKSMDMCEQYGTSSLNAFRFFVALCSRAELFVCHNMPFDFKMLEIEAAYHNMQMPSIETYCTMKAATPICKIPGRYNDYKWPKVSEALWTLTGRELGEDAHDAMFDAKACRDVFFAIKDYEEKERIAAL